MDGQNGTTASYTLIEQSDLDQYGNTYEFQGEPYGASVTFIIIDMEPGEGVRLHQHPYQEVFIVQEGQATFTVGTEQLEIHGGQIVVVPPNTPHKFVNSGTGQLRQVDVHAHKHFITEWLED